MRSKKFVIVLVAMMVLVTSMISVSAANISIWGVRVNYLYNGSYYYSQASAAARVTGGGKGRIVVGLIRSNGSLACARTTTVASGVTTTCYSGVLQGEHAPRAYAYSA